MFPSSERLKNLIESVSQLQDHKFAGHNFDDVIYTGVVRDIVSATDDCDHFYLEVVKLPLTAFSTGGDLTFVGDFHPLTGVDDTTYADKVYVQNVPQVWMPLYYHPGDVIKYWRYTASGDDNASVNGSYVTFKEDTKFKAKVTWCDCSDTYKDGAWTPQGASGCTTNTQPSEKGPVAFEYTFVAADYDPTGTTLALKFPAYQCGSIGDPTYLTGTAFNLSEIFNGIGGHTGTGVDVNADGSRADEVSPTQNIIPLGPQIVEIQPIINYNNGVCNFIDFYFGPIPNSFADQTNDATNCCSPLRCLYGFYCTFDCDSYAWGTVQHLEDTPICANTPATDWAPSGFDPCTYYKFVANGNCTIDSDCTSWPEAPDPPTSTVPAGCCEPNPPVDTSCTCLYTWSVDVDCDRSTGFSDIPDFPLTECSTTLPAVADRGKWIADPTVANRWNWQTVGDSCNLSGCSPGNCGDGTGGPTELPANQCNNGPNDCPPCFTITVDGTDYTLNKSGSNWNGGGYTMTSPSAGIWTITDKAGNSWTTTGSNKCPPTGAAAWKKTAGGDTLSDVELCNTGSCPKGFTCVPIPTGPNLILSTDGSGKMVWIDTTDCSSSSGA